MDEKDLRLRLARQLTTYALLTIAFVVALMLIGQVSILVTGTYDEKRNDAFFDVGKYILGVILPVVSAWVGTVLAFYFSRENYESAVRSTTNLVRQITTSSEKLKATSVRNVMINIAEAHTLTLEDLGIVLLKDLLAEQMTQYNRLPVLTKGGIVVCILHKSTINDFLVVNLTSGKIPDLTLQNLLDDPFYAETVNTKGMRFVSREANLDEIKQIMDQEPRCLDVFITTDGTSQTKVIGWVTNAIVLGAAQL